MPITNDGLSWQELSAIIVLGGFIMALGGVVWRLSERIQKGDADVTAKIEGVRADLAEFREKVAREYVSRDAMREMEERLVAAIERLGDRLDRLFEARK